MGNATKEKNGIVGYLPCAGITLTRFYGYLLSRPAIGGTAPRGI